MAIRYFLTVLQVSRDEIPVEGTWRRGRRVSAVAQDDDDMCRKVFSFLGKPAENYRWEVRIEGMKDETGSDGQVPQATDLSDR